MPATWSTRHAVIVTTPDAGVTAKVQPSIAATPARAARSDLPVVAEPTP